MYESIPDMALACINITRGITQEELWARYVKLCNKHKVLPLAGQLKASLKTLHQQGRIKLSADKTTVTRV